MTGNELGVIEKVDIRNIWKDEARDFTPWLTEHISLLGDALKITLESTSSEASVGNYRLDILARDADRDFPVAIENQLGETDHSHLGQLLTYAAGYDAKVAIWIAGKFRDEHREAIDMLNHRTDDESEFYGVVVELWKIGESLPAPHFRVVSAPNQWVREQRQSRRKEETERSQRYRDFFESVVNVLESRPGVPAARKVTGRSWQSFKTSYSGFGYVLSFTSMDGGRARVELYIDCGVQETNKERFDSLENSKEEIESAMGSQLYWERLDDKKACRISAYRKGSVHDDQTRLDDTRNWMVETLPKFKSIFDPKLADLVN